MTVHRALEARFAMPQGSLPPQVPVMRATTAHRKLRHLNRLMASREMFVPLDFTAPKVPPRLSSVWKVHMQMLWGRLNVQLALPAPTATV